MATFLQGATDFFPPEKLFTPNWSLVQQGLMLKQSRYDKGFAQLSSTARAVIDSPLLNEYSKERRSQILADAEQALKDLPNMDLSLPQNVAEASSLFRPFYEDNHILHDMVQTKQYMGQRQMGADLANSSKEEDRNRYWSMGIQDLDDWADDFSKASPEDMLKMRSRRYVSKPNIDDEIMKMFAEGKLKRSFDVLEGQYKYTYENGDPVKVPLVNLYLSKAENDPEAMEGFNVMGRVTRSRFIRENTQNGKYASAEEAARAHDNALANDYYNTQKSVLEGTETSMQKIQMRLDGWKKRADAGTLVAGSKEAQEAIDDQKQYDSLKLKADKIRGDIFDVGGKPAPYFDRITNNPTSFLAQTYLNKMAIDLATSLSQFGTTKVDTNPVYKDLVLPFELKDYELKKQKQLEEFKTNEEVRKQRALYDLKIEYGIPLYDADSGSTSSGTGGTSTPKAPLGPGGINVPTVLDSEKASAANTLPRDKDGQVDTYRLFNEINQDLVRRTVAAKIGFIEKVLDPNEIKDSNGNLIPPDKRGDMINMTYSPKSGETLAGFKKRLGLDPYAQVGNTLEVLYGLALSKYKSWGETGTNNDKYQSALQDLTRINNINDVWTAAIEFRQSKLKEIVNNLAASYPDRAELFKGLLSFGEFVSADDFANKAMEYDYNGLVSVAVNDRIANNRNEIVDQKILSNQRRIARYGDPGGKLLAENNQLQSYKQSSADQKIEEARQFVRGEMKGKYQELINEVIKTWNKSGNEFNYFAEGQKGGGVFNRMLVFYGLSTVKGEDADRFTESLIQTISPYASEKGGGYSDDYVKFSDNDGASVENNSDVESLFKLITPSLLSTVKVGGKDNITQHQFKTSQIAGNDANWAAYTINVDPKWIEQNRSTSETPRLLSKNQAEKLLKGITVYVKKAERDEDGNLIRTIDNSLAAVETGRIGEVDMLLRANNGLFTREITPGFKITVSGLSTGGYKIITDYIKKETKSDGTIIDTPAQDSRMLDQSLDLTNAYYTILNALMSQVYRNEDITKRIESSRVADPQIPKVSWNDILNAAKQ